MDDNFWRCLDNYHFPDSLSFDLTVWHGCRIYRHRAKSSKGKYHHVFYLWIPVHLFHFIFGIRESGSRHGIECKPSGYLFYPGYPDFTLTTRIRWCNLRTGHCRRLYCYSHFDYAHRNKPEVGRRDLPTDKRHKRRSLIPGR